MDPLVSADRRFRLCCRYSWMCAPKSPVLVSRLGCLISAAPQDHVLNRGWRVLELARPACNDCYRPWLRHSPSTSVKRLLHRGRRCLEIFREEETTSASPAKPRRLDQLLGATQLKPPRLEPTWPARYPPISLSSVSSRPRHSASLGMQIRVPTSATILRERTAIQQWQRWSCEPKLIFYFVSLDVLSPPFLLGFFRPSTHPSSHILAVEEFQNEPHCLCQKQMSTTSLDLFNHRRIELSTSPCAST